MNQTYDQGDVPHVDDTDYFDPVAPAPKFTAAEQLEAFRNRRRLKICQRNLKRTQVFTARMAARDKAGELKRSDERVAWEKAGVKAGQLTKAIDWLRGRLL